MRFDSVVFADSASVAALSCFSRMRSEREAGRRTILMPLLDGAGAEAIESRGLATVRPFVEATIGGDGASTPQWRERFAACIRQYEVAHVMAPLGLLAAPQATDYFGALRGALSVERGRDLLFFEERPQSLIPEAVPLRLSGLGVRLPPAIRLRPARRYSSFALRLVLGLGFPPIFGGIRERSRLSSSLKLSFREAADWDPQRALGPKLQPVLEPWREDDSTELYDLAEALGKVSRLGSQKTFKRGMARLAAGAGSKTPVERYWLSLPGALESDSAGDGY